MQTNPSNYFVYILGSQTHDAVKVGIATDLQQQIKSETKTGSWETPRLVYYEHYTAEDIALKRERDIRKGDQGATQRLVESMNPNWLDLSDMLA